LLCANIEVKVGTHHADLEPMGRNWNSRGDAGYASGNHGSEELAMLGSRMRRLRLAQGMTQRDLADPKYTHAYVSTIEAGRRIPSREALEFFAAKLGVGVDELSTGKPADLEPRLEARMMEARIDLSAGQLDRADETLTSILRDAKRYRLVRLEAKVEDARGLSLERRGKPEEALEHYQRAEEILRSEPASARADAVAGKARCFLALGDVRYAIHVLESLLESLDRDGIRDPEALTRLYSSLLDAYLNAGLYERAAKSAAELDRIGPGLTDPLRVAQMHLHVAHLYLVQGSIPDAERSLQRAEDAYRQLNLKTELGYAYLAKGYVLARDGRLGEARHELEGAIAIFEETGDEKDLTRTLNELARVERLEGRLDRARELLERSISIMGDSDTPILAWAHRELGMVLVELDPSMAEKNFRIAIDLYERSEQAVDIAVTYRALGDLLGSRGEDEASCEAYRTGILALEPRL
jgi:tetratricopeptide (TPR) repeat protein